MKKQHKQPCAQCPFRRRSLPGWLGGQTPEEFRWLAQSETRMPCHAHAGRDGVDYGDVETNKKLPQCAGRAIYWSNQLKTPRDSSLLLLPQDRETVFEWPQQFVDHHLDLRQPSMRDPLEDESLTEEESQ